MGDLDSPAYRLLRRTMKAIWKPINAPCGICGQATIQYDAPKNDPDAFELDHRISRKRAKAMGRPDLILDPNNAQPSHCRCNRSKQEGDGPVTLGETSEEF